ncbi:MAG TPA: hypothetical protein VN806_15045 [Caulobacteraceae bacterium]|nr:hypothetical protein [Caulobacteraceae bacterium]
MDLEPTPTPEALFARFDSTLAGSFDGGEVERGDLYEEIAERRAQLECAETLRRVRAL